MYRKKKLLNWARPRPRRAQLLLASVKSELPYQLTLMSRIGSSLPKPTSGELATMPDLTVFSNSLSMYFHWYW
jgi:hypothetical protein